MAIKDFKDLLAWQESHKLVIRIYSISKKFPPSENYGLTSQIRRASISITSNIAEGFGRQTYKEKIHFYYIAHGSITEVKNLLILANDLEMLESTEYKSISEQADIAHKLIQGLITKSKYFLNHKS